MGFNLKRSKNEPMSEINVTPFVDVMLVLLIIFMVTAPLLTVGVQVDLPESAADSLPDDQEPLTITINSKGEVFIQEHKVNYNKIIPKLLAIAKNRTDTRIYVRGDKTINYGRVLEVMGTLSGAGFSKVALISEPYKNWCIMTRSLLYSIAFHTLIVIITALSLPFMTREPISLPPIVSVELIQITDKTNIPFAPKARKILDKVKEEEKRVVSEQAPPSAKAKEKPDRIPLPNDKKEKKKLVEKKQNPEEIKPQIRQSSEFEKEELINTNEIAALIDKAKEEQSKKVLEKNNKLTQSSVKNSFATGLSLSEEDALRAQIFGCWSVPLGLPYDENLLVRLKLELKKDGTILKSEILDHQRMNMPGQKFYKILAESALRAVRLCQPLKVPPTGYEKWKNIQLNFDPTEMLRG